MGQPFTAPPSFEFEVSKPLKGYGFASSRANPYQTLFYSPFCFAMMIFATFVGTSAYVENTIE